MSTRDETIEEIQLSIKYSKEIAEIGDSIERLFQNKDFQKVIDEGYFTKEARRLTLLSADPEITETSRAAILRSIQAIGELHSYLQVKRTQADNARKDIEFAKQTLDDLQDDNADENEGSDAE